MKAAVLHKPNTPLVTERVADPLPASGEILIKVKACGVCHTDVHLAAGEWRLPKLPLVMGHEVAGTVEAVGAGVTQFKEGERVGVPWVYSACGTCEYCTTDHEQLCRQVVVTGLMVDGGYAEYLKAPAAYTVHIPNGLGFREAAPLFCAGLTSYRALKVSGARVGQTVAIWGIGGLGHYAVQIARTMGTTVVGVDIDPAKLRLARELGAEVVVNSREQEPAKSIRELGGAHVVICLAPAADAIAQAFHSLRRCGTLVLVGMPPGDFSLPIRGSVAKGARILTSAVGSRQDLRELLALAASGKIQTTADSTSLGQLNDVFERMRSGRIHGRTVLEFP